MDSIRDRAAREARSAAEEAASSAPRGDGQRQGGNQERLDAELAHLRAEAEQARLAREQAQARPRDASRSARSAQARSVAEEAVARTLKAEVARVSSEMEARFEADWRFIREEASWPGSSSGRPRPGDDGRNPRSGTADSAKEYRLAGDRRSNRRAGRDGVRIWSACVEWEQPCSPGLPPQKLRCQWSRPRPRLRRSTPRRRDDTGSSTPKPVEKKQAATAGFLTISARIPWSSMPETSASARPRMDESGCRQASRSFASLVNSSTFAESSPRVPARRVDLAHRLAPARANPGGDHAWGRDPGRQRALRLGTIGAIEVPIGNHQVKVKHPELGERRQSIEVKFGETTELKLGFDNEEQP